MMNCMMLMHNIVLKLVAGFSQEVGAVNKVLAIASKRDLVWLLSTDKNSRT